MDTPRLLHIYHARIPRASAQCAKVEMHAIICHHPNILPTTSAAFRKELKTMPAATYGAGLNKLSLPRLGMARPCLKGPDFPGPDFPGPSAFYYY